MSEEILINVTPQETRVAVVENGVLQEILIERARRRGIVGNIYKGKVSRVLPGMQAAFVDVGLDRAAFLHVSDIAQPGVEEPSTDINALLTEGDQVMVQVVKDPLGTKGARLTTNLTFPSRYLVMMPGNDALGVSAKIEDEGDRQRLKSIVAEANEGDGTGFIIRTAAEGVDDAAIAEDMHFLTKLWEMVQLKARGLTAPATVHEDLPLALRILRDFVGRNLEKVRIDSREMYSRAREFVGQFCPDNQALLEHYPGERPLFEFYAIEDEIQKALDRKVTLKSGGYLIIDQTEAMTTIDVNTGGYVGRRNLEETIFKTNLEAAQAIARQLRLRNLGGIIILDFIDMQMDEHKRQVMRALEKALEKDYAKYHICDVSPLGLVEMTRKRTRESLEHTLCEGCPTCGGRATLKTAETVAYEIFREILREARQFDSDEMLVIASQAVVDLMLDEESSSVADLEAFIKKPIRFQAETLYTQEQFDVVLV
ncbi:MAG: ribonuclease G [Gammaproteobacteria bacterium]